MFTSKLGSGQFEWNQKTCKRFEQLDTSMMKNDDQSFIYADSTFLLKRFENLGTAVSQYPTIYIDSCYNNNRELASRF